MQIKSQKIFTSCPFWLLLCLVGMTLQPLPAFGWGQEGHRIIAQIAYDHLSPKARRVVDRTLSDHGIVYWANWPDEIKSDTIYPESIRDGWHFQDLPAGLTDSALIATLTVYPAEGGNLFRALDSIVVQLKEQRASPSVHTLRFLIHLVGDWFCPMHTAHLDDKGGNAVRMKWFGRDTNLHAVWDSKLIESQGYSYTEYAEMLERTYAPQRRPVLRLSREELLIRNYRLTESVYAYQPLWDGNTYHYIYRWHQPMEEQLYIAGIRLAKLLNAIY